MSGVGCGEAGREAVLAHLVFLMRADAGVAAGLRAAKQHEAGGGVFGKIRRSGRMVEHSSPDQAAGASETPALVANRGELDSGSLRGVPYVLIAEDLDGFVACGGFEDDPVAVV